MGDPNEARELLNVDLNLVDANPAQVRTIFSEEEITELAASIASVGVLQPVLLTRAGARFQLVAGERRVRAARTAGLTHIPAILQANTDEADSRLAALLENLQRENLTAMELGQAYQQIMEERQLSVEELAKLVGVNYKTLTFYLRMRDLPEAVQRRISSKVLTFGHAKALLPLLKSESGREYIVPLAEQANSEGLSVRQLEERVAVAMSLHRERPSERKGAARAGARHPAALAAQSELRDWLETKVTVSGTGKRGSIVIPYRDPEDLERICRQLNAGRPAQ